MRRAAAGLVLVAVLAALGWPAAAGAHAVLRDSTPERGASLERAPRAVTFRFDEPVELAFGSVRVFDARGERVDSGGARHPGGDARAVAVDLRGGLPEGAYVATYRVVSADSHPVSGGFVFSVGSGGDRATAAVADLIDDAGAGAVTDAAFGAAKAVSYLAIALAVGGLLFLAAVWLPALRATSGAELGWLEAADAFAARLRPLAAGAVGAGILASAAGIVLQGATAAGSSAWSALDPAVVSDVLGTRFGTVWGLRLLDWVALGALAAVALARAGLPTLRPASLGAAGVATGRLARPAALAVLVPLLAYLVLSPALAGHAATSDPAALLVPANALHVLAMSAWAGGLVLLVVALPAATRRLDAGNRTRLLAACLERFSPLALGAVIALVATGVVQAVVQLESLGDLLHTAFGRAALAKIVLLLGLIGLGALNRRRSVPRLRALAREDGPPGREGLLLRRTLRTEVALIAGALAATAALTSYPPPASLANGPFAATGRLGPATVELVVDPARVGANEIHLYLSDARTGAQYDGYRDVALELRQPDRGIGPLEPRVDKAGPGHWVARRAQVVPGGDWRLVVRGRASEFEEHRARFEVPVR